MRYVFFLQRVAKFLADKCTRFDAMAGVGQECEFYEVT